jgi:hypothetical protein
MDTSNSTDDAAAGREWRVESLAAHALAIDEVLPLARQRIQLFDVDLAQGGWNTALRIDALTRFLRRRHAQFHVIVHDTRWIEASAPRFVDLLRQFGAAMTVYKTGPAARGAMDPLLIVDERHYVHRFHIDRPRAAAAIDMPHAAKPLVQRFEEIWATGEPGLSGTVLGL